MVDFDLKSYTALYLNNAQEQVRLIRSFINQKDVDIKTAHRVCHTLKGQSIFMGFDKIGHKAFELEKYYKNLLDNSQNIASTDISAILDEIEKLLLLIET